MSCCTCLNHIATVLALLASIAGLILGIYAVIKINENSDISAECDLCITLLKDENLCKDVCEDD